MSVPNEQMSQDLSNLMIPDLSEMSVSSENLISANDDNGIAEKIKCVFSASGISALCAEPEKDALPMTARNYVQSKFANRTYEGGATGFKSAATNHGNENELNALLAFEKATGISLSNTGDNQAHLTYGNFTVAHPDGVILSNDGSIVATAEAKCPFNGEIHISYLKIIDAQTLKELNSQYYWQVACQQICADCNKTYFISYDPRNEKIPLHWAEISVQVEDINFLKHRIKLAEEYLQVLMNEDASAVPFVESDEPVMSVSQLPRVNLEVEDVVRHHHEPEVLVQKISIMAGRFVFDMATAKGRDACRSHASQIIKCITPAKEASKQLAVDAKKVINADLHFRNTFEAGVREIADFHRRPLTEWEKEQERLAAEQRAEQERIEREAREAAEYLQAWDVALTENELFDFRKEKFEREKAERERLAEQQRQEREAKAIADAVLAEQERAKREQQEKDLAAQHAIEKAEQERIASEQRAEQAAQAERERIAREQAEQARIEHENAQRLEHRVKVDDEIVKALEANGFSFDDAVKIIDLAANKQLGRLHIAY